MKSTSIAILVLVAAMATCETSFSVEVDKSTSYVVRKSLDFILYMKSGPESNPVKISENSCSYTWGNYFELLSKGVYNVVLRIKFKNTTEDYGLTIIQPQLEGKSKEFSDEKDRVVSTNWVNLPSIDCPEGNLDARIIKIESNESSFIVQIEADCTNKDQTINRMTILERLIEIKKINMRLEELEMNKKDIEKSIKEISDIEKEFREILEELKASELEIQSLPSEERVIKSAEKQSQIAYCSERHEGAISRIKTINDLQKKNEQQIALLNQQKQEIESGNLVIL
jgi:hypothetical protein